MEDPIQAEIVLYQSEGTNVPVQVRYMDETLWMPQKEIAELFDTTKQSISYHLSNIFKEGELERDSVVKEILTTASDGKNYKVMFYALDAIIAVGYRVNSLRATRFRQWATATLKEYITKGFVLNDDMLKNGRPFGKDYFDELLARIRDIRASERRLWLKITDIFQECSFDYDKDSTMAKNFYAAVQNKMHYAVTGHTAAEIVQGRSDPSKPNMGLTSWKGGPEGRIHSSDVTVAKNYLSEDEIRQLNRLVTMLLDTLEDRAEQHRDEHGGLRAPARRLPDIQRARGAQGPRQPQQEDGGQDRQGALPRVPEAPGQDLRERLRAHGEAPERQGVTDTEAHQNASCSPFS